MGVGRVLGTGAFFFLREPAVSFFFSRGRVLRDWFRVIGNDEREMDGLMDLWENGFG
jgi:hypothetical protein